MILNSNVKTRKRNVKKGWNIRKKIVRNEERISSFFKQRGQQKIKENLDEIVMGVRGILMNDKYKDYLNVYPNFHDIVLIT